MRCHLLAAAALLLGAAPLQAQRPRRPVPRDTAIVADSARADTSGADTTRSRDPLARFVESTVIRSLGPAAYSGRVTAIAVPRSTEPRPRTFFIGSAGGGVWKTV